MGSRTWCSTLHAALPRAGDGEGCHTLIAVLAWQRREGRGRGWGGKDLKLQFIWSPVEFVILPPAKGCCISSHRVLPSWVIKLGVIDLAWFSQLLCPLATSKGLMSNSKLSPSNRFGKTDYLCFTSGKKCWSHPSLCGRAERWIQPTISHILLCKGSLVLSPSPRPAGYLPNLQRIRTLSLAI